MKVSEILAHKGGNVRTVRPDETVDRLAHRLRLERVGAMVVSEDGNAIRGIVSERDIVHMLAERGHRVLDGPVSAIMTTRVRTCTPDTTLAQVARMMTESRFRHLPVIDGGRLSGIVSLGDVVKHRLDEMQLEADTLRDLASTAV